MFNVISQNNKVAGMFKCIFLEDGKIYTYQEGYIGRIVLGKYGIARSVEVFEELQKAAQDGLHYDEMEGRTRTIKCNFYTMPKE